MSKLILHTRSFHPLENFGAGGLGYKGDNRNFSTSTGEGVTSRIKNAIEINLRAAKVKNLFTHSDLSNHPIFGMDQDYSDPELQPKSTLKYQIDPYRKDGDQHVQIFMSYSGKNFAMPLVDKEVQIPEIPLPGGGKIGGGKIRGKDVWKGVVPALDLTSTVDLHVSRVAVKSLTFTCRMVGDGFPNSESFLLDDARTPLFLVTHRRIGSATGQLHGNRRIAIASTYGAVHFPWDRFSDLLGAYWALDYATHLGGPIDLLKEIKSPRIMMRDEWNSIHRKRDAKGGRVRQWWLDNDAVWIKGREGSSMP
jgi:hypothetical protein